MRRTGTKNRFTYATFSRVAGNGRPRVYVRFIDIDSGEIIATRFTGIEAEKTPKATEKAVKPRIAELLAELDRDAIAKYKARDADLADDERLADMSVHDFVS